MIEIKQTLTHSLHSSTQIGSRSRARSVFDRFGSVSAANPLSGYVRTRREFDADAVDADLPAIFDRVRCQSAGQFAYRGYKREY